MRLYSGKEGVFSADKGKIEGSENMWKDIILCEDDEKRVKMIDSYVKIASADSNGFFGLNDIISTGQGRGFVLDDMNLYYEFFKNLKMYFDYNESLEFKHNEGSVLDNAIRKTINDYAGLGCDREKRLQLTQSTVTDDGDIKFPSIREQYKKGTLLCTEKASIAHNLWLLSGRTSYFCFTSSDTLSGGEEFSNDMHNFTIIDNGHGLTLYDVAMNNYCKLPEDTIEKTLQGQPLVVTKVNNPGVYADPDGKLKEHKKE